MKTELDMGRILEGYIRDKITSLPFLHTHISHWDCQDTEGDGNVECYFYVEECDVRQHGLGDFNHSIASMLGVNMTDMVEGDKDDGHEGEYRFEYIVNLRSSND